jgi:hypothetical protein
MKHQPLMPYGYILVFSTSHAIRAEKLLGKARVSCKLVPVPREISSDCGVCIRVNAIDLDSDGQTLAAAHLEIAGLHLHP